MYQTLANVLVLCAPYGAPTANCLDFILALREAGATIIMGRATADAACTRNNQAGQAMYALSKNPVLQWVFWLDSDMSAGVDSVSMMIDISKTLQYDSIPFPSISGSYINRHAPDGRSELAAFALKGSILTEVELEVPNTEQVQSLNCVPALTGLGCFLQHVDSFLAHCDESEKLTYPKKPDLIPCVCQAHIAHASELGQYLELEPADDDLYWMAEDFDYCSRELDQGRLVYVAPIAFGHDKVTRLLPDAKTVFPGLRKPES